MKESFTIIWMGKVNGLILNSECMLEKCKTGNELSYLALAQLETSFWGVLFKMLLT
jgi:hypothetical protein